MSSNCNIMDEVDCCSLSRSLDAAGCVSPSNGGIQRTETSKLHMEERSLNGTVEKGHDLASLYFSARENVAHGNSSGDVMKLSENTSVVHKGVGNGHKEWSSAQSAVTSQTDDGFNSGGTTLKLFQTQESENHQNEDKFRSGCCFLGNGSVGDKKHLSHAVYSSVNTNCVDYMISHHEDRNQENPSERGVDEIDQGHVTPTFILTDKHSDYPSELSSSQYYAKPEDRFTARSSDVIPASDTTVKESSGSPRESLQAISGSCVSLRSEEAPSTASSCAINQSSTSVIQGQSPPNSKTPQPSSNGFESEELTKRKMCSENGEGEDRSIMIKKLKVSPTIQSDVQYNQNIVSMPREYRIGGTGNYVIDSPSNCTFNLYQNQMNGAPHKQHAFEWAGLPTQTDGIAASDTMPVQALGTIAKLIAQTTNWKTFARRLPMSECCDLEANIKTLEGCEGTTSDKAAAVLMRWWREHSQQSDATAMKARLKEGLQACSLIRLARDLHKYL